MHLFICNIVQATTCAQWLGYFLEPGSCIPSCLHLLNTSATCQQGSHLRIVKLVQLVTMELTSAQLTPYVPSLIDTLLNMATIIATDAQLQDDTVSLLQQLVAAGCCGADGTHGESSSSHGARSSDGATAHGTVTTKRSDVTETSSEKNIPTNTVDATVTQNTCCSNNSGDTNNNEDAEGGSGALPCESLLRLVLLVVGSDTCVHNSARATELLSLLADTTGSFKVAIIRLILFQLINV